MIFNEISNVFELCATHYNNETLQHCIRVAKMAAANPTIESQDEREVIRNTNETYDDYICRLRSSRNKLAYIVKLCDIKDHLTQKETLTDSLKERYLKALPVLL